MDPATLRAPIHLCPALVPVQSRHYGAPQLLSKYSATTRQWTQLPSERLSMGAQLLSKLRAAIYGAPQLLFRLRATIYGAAQLLSKYLTTACQRTQLPSERLSMGAHLLSKPRTAVNGGLESPKNEPNSFQEFGNNQIPTPDKDQDKRPSMARSSLMPSYNLHH